MNSIVFKTHYKGFTGSYSYSQTDKVYSGKIDNIPDLVTFECDNILSTAIAFREAVDDYIDLCKSIGKSFK